VAGVLVTTLAFFVAFSELIKLFFSIAINHSSNLGERRGCHLTAPSNVIFDASPSGQSYRSGNEPSSSLLTLRSWLVRRQRWPSSWSSKCGSSSSFAWWAPQVLKFGPGYVYTRARCVPNRVSPNHRY
jgi:hypothetical protein